MEKYVRFEVERSRYSRNHLLGIWLTDKKEERRDRLMCFNSPLPKEEADKLIIELCIFFNNKIK